MLLDYITLQLHISAQL